MRFMTVANGQWRIVALTLQCLVLTSCGAGSRSERFEYAPSNFTRPDPISSADITQEYRLGPGDVVNVGVYRALDLSGDLRVDEAGKITMPLIGEVQAQGKTTLELASSLRSALAQKYYEDPIVNVALKEAAGQRITVDGSVNAPGVYPISGKTTLMQAVALARGTKDDANLRKVVIFRTVQGQRMAAAFDLKSIRESQMVDPEVYGSDIIVVDGNESRRILRDIIGSLPIFSIFRPLY